MSRAKAGFTLVELACACAVIGILLAIVAPAVGTRILQARVGAEAATLQAMESPSKVAVPRPISSRRTRLRELAL